MGFLFLQFFHSFRNYQRDFELFNSVCFKLFIKKSDSRFAFVRFVNHTHDYRLHSVIFSLLMLLTDIYSETCVVYGIVRL